MSIKSLIIDDNPFIIDLLTEQLQQNHPEIEIVGFAKSGAAGIEKIKKHQPNLIFLDVEMPDMTGFDMLDQLNEISFQTIFITSFSHYAIRAIRFNALDYLVKPIEEKELKHAIKRYLANIGQNENRNQVKLALLNLKTEKIEEQTLQLPSQNGAISLKLKQIVRIEGERNYSFIHLANGKKQLSSKTLGYFDEILSDKGFFRCHRSHLVNGIHIKDLKNNGVFILKNAIEISISRRKKTDAKNWHSQLKGL